MTVAAAGSLPGEAVPVAKGRPALAAALRHPAALLLLPACVAVAAGLLLPILYLLALSLNPPVTGEVALAGELTLRNYARLLDWFYFSVLLRTLWVSAVTTAISTVLGVAVAHSLWRTPPHRRGLLVVVVLAPLLVSIVARTFGWMLLLGDQGLVNAVLLRLGLVEAPLHLMFTQGAVIVGLVHVFLPFMVLSVLAAYDRIDPAIPEAAGTLGAGPFTVFRETILPLLNPGIAAGVTIVFSLAMSSYVTPALMGGSGAGVLTTLIYQQLVVTYDWHFAAALVAVLLASTLLLLGAVLYHNARRTRAWMTRPGSAPR
ncbi:ABC transporter permease [Roseomonas sp. NAR14]|uniref:ABC transporter permease n=1 Tax=Roseomonas acroporae TaxID=2937791 RepID=A0A9X1Y6Z7_9PROT|nr:ABC transporter permease [Roseomonas acroporae]MCK8784270.1 ABC transporter permease [Roseomonas acroporae]